VSVANDTIPKDRPITREDLRAGFASLQGEVGEAAESAKSILIAAGAAAIVAVAAIAFLLGKRRGRKDKTYIEIRRV
jgi:hypothetical protein